MKKVVDIEKDRAEFAYKKVEEIADEKYNKTLYTDVKKEEYKSYVKKIPTMIQTNGISATFAFMFSKKKTYKIIYDQINEWLQKRNLKKEEELVKWIIGLDSSMYKYVSVEILYLLNWMRRFAEGMIRKENNGKEKEKTTS